MSAMWTTRRISVLVERVTLTAEPVATRVKPSRSNKPKIERETTVIGSFITARSDSAPAENRAFFRSV